MQQFSKFITLCLCAAQHVLGVLTPIIRSSTTAVAASGFTVGACAVHTQTSSNSSTIAADSNGVTNTRCCRYSCLCS
jgi:hypothetical protein